MGALFGGRIPAMPQQPDAVRVPDEEDPKFRAERRRKMEEERVSGGRASTDLSGPFRNPTLGA